jgi:SAM-dependent methyltransferase
MILGRLKEHVSSAISLGMLRLDPSREKFCCPICGYFGAFLNLRIETGIRPHARCPKCKCLERHRLQWMTVKHLQKEIAFSKLRVLHVAPEKFIQSSLRCMCASYLSTDLNGTGVDCQEDLTDLSFPANSFDLVYCSHVLEHIKDDLSAIRQIRRVLSPGGIAILPVPFISDFTIEYPEVSEHGHVRAPGLDYIDRLRSVFRDVRVFSSDDFDQRYQLYTHEDRSCWPTPGAPYRRASFGLRHLDYVPVCRAD